MEYSLFTGGKRFRPVLSSLVADTYKLDYKFILPFASAVEMVHTYSLIHDDLPCMDNDDVRRGEPTNHIKFDEATALLAGDALLTEAFYIISQHYGENPAVGLKLCLLLSEAAGTTGMVAGQVADVSMLKDHENNLFAEPKDSVSKNLQPAKDELLKMHELKTGALIRVAAEGAAIIAMDQVSAKTAESTRSDDSVKVISQFGLSLGLAFQLADDILDYDPKNLEGSGFPKLIGIEETKNLLAKTTKQALTQLEIFGLEAQGLRDLIEYNFSRKL